MNKLFATWRQDVPASLVVFLVALPLCLGVALASTGDKSFLFSGVIAGVVGGIVVGFISGSSVGVSGPAAGLITLVYTSIGTLGSYPNFLVAVVLAGVIQLISGFLKAGVIGHYFPFSVIKGMLAAIGLTLILKEIPHAFGYDADFMGDEAFFQEDGNNTFTEILIALKRTSLGAIIISLISILVLVLFDTKKMKSIGLFKIIPSALIVVLLGIGLNQIFYIYLPELYLNSKHLVELPVASSFSDVGSFFIFPDFSALANYKVYSIAFTIALVASLETILSVEATDKLDPEKRKTPNNLELKAQGVGNIVSGLLGGLPVTQVIVRSSANVNSGGRNKLSTILHGCLLFVSVIFIPKVLNLIPLASLAAILLLVGYKLSKVSIYKHMYQMGWDQFIPFIVTIVGVLLSDLLTGITFGMVVSIFFILRKNFTHNFEIQKQEIDGKLETTLILSESINFLNKGGIRIFLKTVPNNSKLIIDGTKCKEIDYDVLVSLINFKAYANSQKSIEIEMINIPDVKLAEF